jgi:hypothetical protein
MSYEQVKGKDPLAALLHRLWAFIYHGDVWAELALAGQSDEAQHRPQADAVFGSVMKLSLQHSIGTLVQYSPEHDASQKTSRIFDRNFIKASLRQQVEDYITPEVEALTGLGNPILVAVLYGKFRETKKLKNESGANELYVMANNVINTMQARLKENLSSDMIPSYFIRVGNTPTTDGGMIDRVAIHRIAAKLLARRLPLYPPISRPKHLAGESQSYAQGRP